MRRTGATIWQRQFRSVALLLIAVLAVATLAACGGSDDNGGTRGSNANHPVFAGAQRLDSAKMKDEDVADMGFKASNGELAGYKTDKPFREVSDYYTNGVKSAGWNVGMTLPFGETTLAILSKDKTVVVATVMSAKDAKGDGSFINQEDLEQLKNVRIADLKDNETLILIANFTCDEDDITTCTSLGM
jgi:hypothetical protein